MCFPVASSASGGLTPAAPDYANRWRWPRPVRYRCSYLLAEGALLVRNGAGHLSLWFDVAGDTGPRFLAPARRGGLCRTRLCRDVNLV